MANWDEILDSCGPAVWRQALRMLGNEADAADCYQAVVLEALELSRREEIRNWPALLRRLAVVRALDRLRERYRRRADPQPVEAHLIAGRGGAAAAMVEGQELAERLREALATLPESQAEAFALRHLDELTNEQIAGRMGLTPNHVAVLVHRARATLRVLLGDEREPER